MVFLKITITKLDTESLLRNIISHAAVFSMLSWHIFIYGNFPQLKLKMQNIIKAKLQTWQKWNIIQGSHYKILENANIRKI